MVLPELLRSILAGDSLKDYRPKSVRGHIARGVLKKLTFLATCIHSVRVDLHANSTQGGQPTGMIVLELGQIINILVDYNP